METNPVLGKPPRPNNKRIFKIIGILVVAFVGMTILSKCVRFEGGFPMFGKKDKKIEKKSASEIPLPVKAYRVSMTDFTDTLPALGTLKGYREIDLKFSESGYIEYINFKDGERVVEGDIIASLDQREALLKLEYAKNELEKNQKLFELGSIIELKLNQTKLEYQSARMDYEKTNMIAPYDGYIGSLEVEKGDFVTPNDKIGNFVNLTDAYVEYGIIEKDISKVKIGQEITLSVDSYPQDVFSGEIESISPIVEGKSRTFKVKARVTNEDEKLKAGMFGRVGVLIYEKQNALIIPSAAFKKKEDEYFVYVVHPDKPEAMAEGAGGVPETQGPAAKEPPQPMMGLQPDAKAKMESPEGKSPPKPLVGRGAPSPTEGAAGGGPAIEEVQFGSIEVRPIQIAYTTPDAVEIKAGLEEGEIIVADLQQDFEEKARVEITEIQESVF